MFGGDAVGLIPEGYQLPRGEQSVTVFDTLVSDGYFETMAIRILQGRSFRESDQANTPLVAVVNQHFANHYWPRGDALGKRFHLKNASGPLVQNCRHCADREIFLDCRASDRLYIYLPYTQNPRSALTIIAGTQAQDASILAPVLRKVVRGLDANMPAFDERTMKDFYTQRAVKTPNMITESVAGLGLMGLILAMIGLYGLVAYSVSRRTREIGIRMAIGADRQKVIRMILKQGLILGSFGVAAGLVISVFACRAITSAVWIASFGSTSPLLFAMIAVPLLLITVLATYAPARRASLIDPMRALREE